MLLVLRRESTRGDMGLLDGKGAGEFQTELGRGEEGVGVGVGVGMLFLVLGSSFFVISGHRLEVGSALRADLAASVDHGGLNGSGLPPATRGRHLPPEPDAI